MPDLLTVIPAKSIAPLAVNLATAARLVGLSQRTVRELVRSNVLPAAQPGGRGGKLIFRVSTLETWLESQESQAAGIAERGPD
jgi:excisionase family DNA binding protein